MVVSYCVARLAQGNLCVVHVLLGDRAFLEQRLPVVEHRLLRVERVLRRPHVEFRLLHFLGHGAARGRLIVRVRLVGRGLAFRSGRKQVRVLELHKQLTGVHLSPRLT